MGKSGGNLFFTSLILLRIHEPLIYSQENVIMLLNSNRFCADDQASMLVLLHFDCNCLTKIQKGMKRFSFIP